MLLQLPYVPPYDWASVLSFFRAHHLPHIESVDDVGFERVVRTSQGMGWFRVSHDEEQQCLELAVWNSAEEEIPMLSSRVRCMFDLDADPHLIRSAMGADAQLASVWERHPGLRVGRSWSGFEAMLTTILGQLVSVRFGRTLVDELMKAAGAEARHPKTAAPIHLFPTAKRLLAADLSAVRTSASRRSAIRALATLVAAEEGKWEQRIHPKELRKLLLAVPGIGAWTSEYIAMRGFHDDDAFPATDYGLKQELKRHPGMDVNRVRPWRAYAAAALWKSFSQAKAVPGDHSTHENFMSS